MKKFKMATKVNTSDLQDAMPRLAKCLFYCILKSHNKVLMHKLGLIHLHFY